MFEFYFQNGEFESGASFFHDVGVQVFAWALAGLSAFLIFKAQQRLYIKNKRNEKSDRENDKLAYLCYLVQRSIKFTEVLLEGLNKFITELESDPFNIGDVQYDIEDDLVRMTSKVDQEEYFHAFRYQLGQNDLSPIFYGLDVVKAIKDEIFDYMTKYKLEIDQKRKRELGALVVSARNLLLLKCRELKQEGSKDGEQFIIYNYFLLLHQDAVNKNPSDFVLQHKEFITPSRNIIVDHLKKGSYIIETIIMDAIIEPYKVYNEIVSANVKFLDRVKDRTKQISIALDMIKPNSKLLIERYGVNKN